MPSRKRFLALAMTAGLLSTLAIALPGARVAAATLPTGFQEQVVLAGLDQPTNIEFAPDGRVFVAEKSGVIKVFDDLADTTPTVFADLTSVVFNGWDRGLLGMALAPSFAADPSVYVLYTYDAPPGQNAPYWNDGLGCGNINGGQCVVTARLSRVQAGGSEQVLIRDWCQQFASHSIGDLAFGQDGALYVTSGDGASFNTEDYGQLGSPPNPCADPPNQGGALRSQDVRTLADPTGLNGSLLRLNPATAAAMTGNPLIGSADLNARRIVAHGLRNPFRFAVRPGTNEVWIGDVGWRDWEEINVLPNPTAGLTNFGWPCYEGSGRMAGYDNLNIGGPGGLCESLYPTGHAGPVYTYNHASKVVAGESCPTGGSSVSGLAFYPNSGGPYPAEFRGALFFADYSRNCIWAMKPATLGGPPIPAYITTFVAGAANPVDLEVGPGGDLYYVDHLGGTIRRIRYFAGNQPPTAVISASPTGGNPPLTVQFNGTGSTDPDPADAGRLTYAWDFTNNGSVDSTSANPTFTYTTAGVFTARLTVKDTLGATGTATILITPGNAGPTPTIDTPNLDVTWGVDQTISFSGHATDPQQGNLPASALTWRLTLQHCSTPTSCHAHPIQSWPGITSGSFKAPDHEYPSYLDLELVATDATGLTRSVVRRLNPRTVDVTVATSPPGLRATLGGYTGAAPFTRKVIEGSTTTVSAPTPQILGITNNVFSSWSDGGAQTHTVTASTDSTYTAIYQSTQLPCPENGMKHAYPDCPTSGPSTADVDQVLARLKRRPHG